MNKEKTGEMSEENINETSEEQLIDMNDEADDEENSDDILEERKEALLLLMNSKDYKPMRFKEIVYLYGLQTEEEKQQLLDILTMLEEEYKIIKTRNNRYMPTPKDTHVGIFTGNRKGFGFVTVEGYDDDFFIHAKETANAFEGDKVLIRETRKAFDGNRTEATVLRVISHAIRNVIGVYDPGTSFGFVIPNNKKIANDIFIPKEASMGAVKGSIVICDIKDYGDDKKSPSGIITEILGHIDDPASDILTVVKSYNIPVDFPEDVERELLTIPESVSPEEIKGRRDFRNLDTVTIDGEDAKDLDDAITLSFKDGIYTLGVHIADVSNYVKEGSPLDKEALNRGTSNYLIDSVIPMLPHKLSNGICSLNAGVDRLTLSCIMDIDEKGKVLSHEIVEGVINVNERMNYTDVNKLICRMGDAPVERYKPLIPLFDRMQELSRIIRAKRHERGSIDFDMAETEIKVDENHKPVEICAHDRNDATRLIEDFMLMANEVIAEDFFWQELPFEYRTHEAPDPVKVDILAQTIKNFGIYFKTAAHDNIHPKEFQKLLKKIEGEPYEAMISKLTLRSMQQARYSTECTGHFGLACKYYCHFTSPIRRYPDLQIHRIIKEQLHGKLDNERIRHYNNLLPKVAADNSMKERRADEAERDVTRLKEIEYMSERIGSEYKGVISGFSQQNIFVELENTVEGAISVAYLEDDYYRYDEASMCMKGERTGNVFNLGDKVHIKVVRADKIERVIDFKLLKKL
ncbi:RNAse R [Eubacterium ruminantium]|nr:RNAse R [Eubacterium ruminantium]